MSSTSKIKVDADIDPVSDLPEGWAEVTLPQVCQINPPKPAPDALRANAPVTFVPMPAVDADSGTITEPKGRPFSQVRKGYTAFQDGDVIMAKITPCMENGKAAVARSLQNGLGFGSTEFHVLRPGEAVLADFLYHFIRQQSYRRMAENEMTGSVGQKRVPADFLNRTVFWLPPLPEQRRIVAQIQEVFAQNQAVRARLSRAERILTAFRQSVLAAACSSGDDLQLCEVVVDIKYGTAQKCTPRPIGTPVLRIPNIGDWSIDLNDLKYAKLPAKELAALRLRPGDLLMIRSNGSVSLVGKSALVSESEAGFAYAGYLLRLRANRARILPEYLNLALRTHSVREQIEVPARSTSGVHNINSTEVLSLRVKVPALSEQRAAIRCVDDLFELADRIEERVKAATKRAEKLTQAILAKAFRGELVPTGAELARKKGRHYEPASTLLERIKAGREEAAAKAGLKSHAAKRGKK